MRKSAYIITKPLQYINATNIEDENLKDCYLEDNFDSFDSFLNSIRTKSNHWDKIYTCKSKQLGLLKIILNRRKYSKVYLDSDIGIFVRLSLFLLYPLQIYVYEEGFASYTASYRGKKTIKDIILSFVDKILLGKNWSGGSASTRGIYLYNSRAFKSIVSDVPNKKILSFKSDFGTHISMIPEINFLFKGVDFELFRDKKILIYLTSWTINKDINSYLTKYQEYIKIIKPHPHIRGFKLNDIHFDHVIQNMLLAEILVSEIIKISQEVVVIHEGSAAMLTFNESEKFKEYNINTIDNSEKYNQLKELFR